MSLTTVNEESTSWLDIVFTDADGVAACPTDITYRIDCLTTNTTIATWTAFTPASSVREKTMPQSIHEWASLAGIVIPIVTIIYQAFRQGVFQGRID